MVLSRRDLGKLALAAIPASRLLAKPNSNFDGVQIGVITYSYRSMPGANDAEALLKYIVDSGISGIELMGPAAEIYAGSPAPQGRGGGGGGRGPGGAGGAAAPGGPGRGPGGGGGGGRAPMTPEQQAAQQARAAELKAWRLSVSMDKYKALRKMYNDAGVDIYAFKLEPNPNMSDEEYEYIFHVADTLGANHVTLELSNDAAFTKRIGEFAAKKRMRVAYHAHLQATITAWDGVLEQSTGNAINLDCGHFVAGTSESPIPLIRKHSGRIASMHLKDRKKASNGAANLPWGQGETPIKEILMLVRQEKYKFPSSIELEYQIPEGSDAVVETSKCVQFCKNALA
ncbi:MAG TPA: sugar phosphate isomerase/epimerase [Candidatus Acidoferrum sp.]|nr:sugar phosphate isomerase/epimerase [Candidatus Acidoferrum sp.]